MTTARFWITYIVVSAIVVVFSFFRNPSVQSAWIVGMLALIMMTFLAFGVVQLTKRVDSLEKIATADRIRRIHEADAAQRQGRHPR